MTPARTAIRFSVPAPAPDRSRRSGLAVELDAAAAPGIGAPTHDLERTPLGAGWGAETARYPGWPHLGPAWGAVKAQRGCGAKDVRDPGQTALAQPGPKDQDPYVQTTVDRRRQSRMLGLRGDVAPSLLSGEMTAKTNVQLQPLQGLDGAVFFEVVAGEHSLYLGRRDRRCVRTQPAPAFSWARPGMPGALGAADMAKLRADLFNGRWRARTEQLLAA